MGIFVVGLIVLGIATYIFLIQREKAQFAKAEKEIDALYAQIVQKVGKPDQEKKTKSCGYASRVYGRGPRSCSIGLSLLYEGKSAENSNTIVNDVFSVSGGTYLQSYGDKTVNKFIHQDSYRIDQKLDQDFRDTDGLVCNLGYNFPVVKEFSESFSPKNLENLEINITCSGPAMAEYFLVTKD